MDRILKRVLIVSLWLIVINFDARAQSDDPETVTFQGAVIRHALSDKSVEVSGVIRFLSDGVVDGEYYNETVEHVFTIPAGQQSIAYSESLDWMIPGTDINRTFKVSVQCQINCEQGSVYEEEIDYSHHGKTVLDKRFFNDDDPELFGADVRDDAYIVNLNLLPSYFLIQAKVVLPNEQVARQDIPFTMVSIDAGAETYEYWAELGEYSFVIEQGKNAVDIDIKVDFEEDFTFLRIRNSFYIGYKCISLVCEEANLAPEGWLGSAQGEIYSEPNSVGRINVGPFFGDDDLYLQIENPLQLLSRDTSIKINVTADFVNSVELIEVNVFVKKYYVGLYCAFGVENIYAGIDEGTIHKLANESQDDFCYHPWWLYLDEIVEESNLQLISSSSVNMLALDIPTLKGKQSPGNAFGYTSNPNYYNTPNFSEDSARKPYMIIGFECTSGCENSQNLTSGYLAENGKFSARSEGGAKRFYQSNNLLQDNLLLNLIRPPLIMPWLELLMDEEAGTDVDTTAN